MRGGRRWSAAPRPPPACVGANLPAGGTKPISPPATAWSSLGSPASLTSPAEYTGNVKGNNLCSDPDIYLTKMKYSFVSTCGGC